MRSILFVCSANRCRSPMAAALLKDKLSRRGQTDAWVVASAGTWADPDLAPTTPAQAEMARRGLDISTHRARTVDAYLLGSASLVVVMTRDHRESLCAEFPGSAHKVVLLSELIGQVFDIADPLTGAARDYRQCSDELDQVLEQGFERLAALADQADSLRGAAPKEK